MYAVYDDSVIPCSLHGATFDAPCGQPPGDPTFTTGEPLETALVGSVLEDDPTVCNVHLLEEDEGENCVRPEAGVVWCEALPEAEEALVSYHLAEDVLIKKK